jgi:hypothetical protein
MSCPPNTLRGEAHSAQRLIDAARRLYVEIGATAQVERLTKEMDGYSGTLPSS